MPRRRRHHSEDNLPLPFVYSAILAVIALLPAFLITATVGVFAVERFAQAIPGLDGSSADVITLKKCGLGIVFLLSLTISSDLYRLLKLMLNKAMNSA